MLEAESTYHHTRRMTTKKCSVNHWQALARTPSAPSKTAASPRDAERAFMLFAVAFAFHWKTIYSSGAFVIGNRRAHHEYILQSCSGNPHVFSVLLFYNSGREHHFCVGLGAVDVLTYVQQRTRGLNWFWKTGTTAVNYLPQQRLRARIDQIGGRASA